MYFHFILLLAVITSIVFAKHSAQHHHDEIHSNDQTSLFVEFSDLQYNLTWNADFDNQELIFKIKILKPKKLKNDQWLMFGFSDHGKEEDSDFCLFNNGGNRKMIDGYLDYNLEPKIDIQQDCHLEGYDWNKGQIVFRRKFTTCDIRDYAIEVCSSIVTKI
uniref:DOMON domain-containing protein n=1 Tax=Panagrolaimus davidi TaxID=227884 RepID=A0A914Q4Z9_9BILA